MRLGLFNWTSDLSDEPEYPPFFDKFSARFASYSATHWEDSRCVAKVFDTMQQIGWIEDMGGPPYEEVKKRYGRTWKELEEYQENAFYGAYREGSFMHMILNEPVFLMSESPDTVLPLTSEESKLNFYYWEGEMWWICINQEWNRQIVKILERKNPDDMAELAKCRRERELSGMTVGEIKEILRNANQSTSGKKTDLIQRIIDHNLI